jgi:hypothetical protein
VTSPQLRDQNAMLLLLAEQLAGAATVDEVAEAITFAATDILGTAWTYLGLKDAAAGLLRFVPVEGRPGDEDERWLSLPLGGHHPAAVAVGEGVPVLLEDAASTARRFPATWTAEEGPVPFEASAHVPLPVPGDLGSLTLVWDRPVVFDAADERFLLTVARFVGLAVSRALLLDERREAAAVLQRELLTDLPVLPGLELAARYLPSSDRDQVGGDWFDAFADDRGGAVLVIGDVTGHDVQAAATMGQLRAMLRACAYEGDLDPAQILSRLDRTVCGLEDGAMATVLVARVDPGGPAGTLLRWSVAGHPDPVLLAADGSGELLTVEHDPLVGFDPAVPRRTWQRRLAPGATLLMFTDGLVERRDVDADAGAHALLARLTGRPAGRRRTLDDLLDDVLLPVHSSTEDDVAVLAVRLDPRV